MCNDDSGLREAVLQLTDTVLQLKGAVEKLANKEEDPNDISPAHLAEEESWETARDTLQDQTKETVDAWKDELNNRFVFAGLFSAVVTAFTVESYTWLQQDPGDVSNTLLAQISLQLSAFTFGSTFLNSTSRALPLSNVTASFSPVSYAVSVNTLWVLSLTLSLISAFFAITAQQWLRQLRLPPDMPVRLAIRLMAVRADALQAWQVPSIISLLPLLLQVAVIFFLIGLFLLLQALNATVAVAFGIVALVALTAFLATTSIPLLSINCPYKSPVIPTGAILLQSLSYPLALAVTPVILGLKAMLQQLPEFIRMRQRHRTTSKTLFYWYSDSEMSFLLSDATIALRLALAVGAFYELSLISYIKSFGRHTFVDMGQFWLFREYQYLHSRQEDDDEHEQSSLVSVLLSAPSRSFSKIVPCLRCFHDWNKDRIARVTVERSLRAIVPRQHDVIDRWGQLGPEAKPYVSTWLSSRHRRLLCGLLRQRDWTQDREVGWGDGRLLTLFHEIDGADFVTPRRFVKHLLHVCLIQNIFERFPSFKDRPACLLLHFIRSSSYVLDEQDVEGVHQSASRVFDRDFAVYNDTCRLILASGALFLHTLKGEGAAGSYGLSAAVLSALSAFLNKGEAVVVLQSLCQYSYSNPNIYPKYMHMSRLILNLCSATQYSSHLDLTLPAYSLSRITAVLRAVCSHSDYEGKPEMVEASGWLDVIDSNIGTVHVSTGWELLVEGWDGYLAALVIAQDMKRVTEESILEPAMEGLLIAESRLSSLAALDGIDDETIDQHANSSATVSWKALGRCTCAFKIASAMPPPDQMNHGLDEGVAEEDHRSLC